MSSTSRSTATDPADLPDDGTDAPDETGAPAADETVAPAPEAAAAPVAAQPDAPVPTEPEGRVTTIDDDLDEDDLDEDLLAGGGLVVGDAAFRTTTAPGLAARIGAEALGSFVLVLVVLGITLYLPLSDAGLLGVALAGGLALAGLTAAFGRVSGAHILPPVTIGSAIAGRTPWVDVLPYWLAQLIGAVAAAATAFLTIPETLPPLLSQASPREFFTRLANGWGEGSFAFTVSQGGTSFDLRAVFIVEMVATALLVAVVLATARRTVSGPRSLAPLAAGSAFAALLLLVSPISGGSLNPARSTAAALFSDGAFDQLWLFWVAPLLGAAVAGLLSRAFSEGPVDELGSEDLDEPVLVVERPGY